MRSELLTKIDSFINGTISRFDLENWLISSLQRILSSGDSLAIDLANNLDADIVELSMGHLTEQVMREKFLRYSLAAQTFSWLCHSEAVVSSGASYSSTVELSVPVTVREDHLLMLSIP